MGQILTNQNLKAYNTFGISVVASRFASFSSSDELNSILKESSHESLLILGGGSNMLFTQDFHGLVLKNEIKGFEIVEETEKYVIVRSGAGEIWHEFVSRCIRNGFAGLENLSLIPGSVGASPIQNIGAYGVEIKDVFHALEAFHISSGEIHSFTTEQCEFGYRESVFKRKLKGQYVITSVSFKLSKNPIINTAYGAIESELVKMGVSVPTIEDVSNAVIAIRSSKLPNPKEIGNAGSFFKNPVVQNDIVQDIREHFPDVPAYKTSEDLCKIPAGWLIEQAGWKGKTMGTYGVHKNQALVLVNYGGATGKEIFELSEMIIRDVKSKFGVDLEREVNIL
jgi:UDP-N-acetylmuramate dehydrogenase